MILEGMGLVGGWKFFFLEAAVPWVARFVKKRSLKHNWEKEH